MFEDDEAGAVARVLAGDRRAYGEIVDRYQRVLYNVALRMVNHREDAQDIVQSAFVKAFEKLATYDPRRKLFSWIYRITVNECLNHLARRRRGDSDASWTEAEGPSQEEDLDRQETERMIGAALLELPADQRGVIILRHFIHLSHHEMSRILEVPEKTVKSRLHTARKVLGDVLRRQGVTRA
jgi:RNA polymerase sigma factor (sigma-70 family)